MKSRRITTTGELTMNELVERLTDEFSDKEYAHAYMEEHGNMILAAQIKTLREQRGLTQTKLAQLAGMKQERISALENVDYDAWTVSTLRKLAEAFDTGLQVSFVPVSSAIMSVVNISKSNLEVSPREDDLESFRKHKIIMSSGHWKAIDKSYLATVETLAPRQTVEPVQPKHSWQRLNGENQLHAIGG